MKLWASQTAEAVCLFRAAEQRRPEGARVIDDPFAHLFLGPLSRTALEAMRRTGRFGDAAEKLTAGLQPYIVARHRFIDDALSESIASGGLASGGLASGGLASGGLASGGLASGGLDRLVLLGAGYDARPFRFAEALTRAGVEVVEIDHPATSKRREAIVARHTKTLPRIDRRVVRVDFEREVLADRLEDEGLLGATRTFWIWEGVSMYLTRAAVQRTLATLHAACGPASELCLDLWFLVDEPSFRGTLLRTVPGALSIIGEPITFGLHPEDAPAFLGAEGWKLEDLADADVLAKRYLGERRPAYRANYVVHARRA